MTNWLWTLDNARSDMPNLLQFRKDSRGLFVDYSDPPKPLHQIPPSVDENGDPIEDDDYPVVVVGQFDGRK